MMRGILIWSGEADAAKVTGRAASFVKETETVRQGYFTELLCVRAGKYDRAEAEKVLSLLTAYLDEVEKLPQAERETLGVITFNAQQRDCILDMIDKKCDADAHFKTAYSAA